MLVRSYHRQHCEDHGGDKKVVEVGEDVSVNEGDAGVVALEEDCEDGTGQEGGGQEDTVGRDTQSQGDLGHRLDTTGVFSKESVYNRPFGPRSLDCSSISQLVIRGEWNLLLTASCFNQPIEPGYFSVYSTLLY